MSRGTGRMTGQPRGSFLEDVLKTEPDSQAGSPVILICGFVWWDSLPSASSSGFFIWVKDILRPFMSEWFLLHVCSLWGLLHAWPWQGGFGWVLLPRREPLGGGEVRQTLPRAASWGAAPALWTSPTHLSETLTDFLGLGWANKIFPLKGTFHCLF